MNGVDKPSSIENEKLTSENSSACEKTAVCWLVVDLMLRCMRPLKTSSEPSGIIITNVIILISKLVFACSKPDNKSLDKSLDGTKNHAK